ncbi:NAD(P)H-hydrate dehydratase [Primorskyibacter sp. 2E107]|uniref:NAD(P)H-hydrate dehydratase n=1 Tax=Primorskyibacter sp. 2E107 TaxID=3403458 RepID=UPI003AF9E4DD
MTELLTAAQMRAIEKAAIDSGAVTGLELMERAGRGVVEAVLEEWPELVEGAHRAVVLCGPGNNGGDGFVVARLLKARGWAVEVFLYGDALRLPPDAKVNYERWCGLGEVSPAPNRDFEDYFEDHPDTVLAVDALFGTGLSRPFDELGFVQDELNDWSSAIETYRTPRVVSVDVPSGMCADSGLYLGVEDSPFDQSVVPNLTVTFHRRKLGHVLADGGTACGKVVVKSIGLEDGKKPTGAVRLASEPCEKGFYSGYELASRKASPGHKFSHGHALILSGGFGRTGAARLAARGALRIGAGLVTLGVPGAAQMEVASQITALMLRRVEGGDDLVEMLGDARLNALCLGPGLGVERARDLVHAALSGSGVKPRPTVLDADALSAFSEKPDALFEILHPSCVITPHMGEFARLFPDIAQKLTETPTKGPAYSKVDATRDAAKRAGCVVLLKGPDTVIAALDGRAAINAAVYERAAPWLATAGSGDVLAGFITGLLARGFDPMQAAETAAWLHVDCALSFGPGLIAEDLPEALPGVFRALAS